MKRSALVELFWRLHPRIYRATGGRVLGKLVGMPVLLLTTTGARSGAERTTALTYFTPEGSRSFVVIGSFLGEPRHPGWIHNLRSKPEATLQVGSRVFGARSHEASGEERAALWRQLVAINSEYRQYEGRTDREIPVVVLDAVD